MNRMWKLLALGLVLLPVLASAQVRVGHLEEHTSNWRPVVSEAARDRITVTTAGYSETLLFVQASLAFSQLDILEVMDTWLPGIAGRLADLGPYASELRAAGLALVSSDGRTIGVRLPWREDAFAAVLARSRQVRTSVSVLALLGKGASDQQADSPAPISLGIGPVSLRKPERETPNVDGALQVLLDSVRQVTPTGLVAALGALPTNARQAVGNVAEMLGIPLDTQRSEVTVIIESRAPLSPLAAGAREASPRTATGLTVAKVPLTQLESFLAQVSRTAYVRLPYEPYPLAVTSEGVAAVGAPSFHAQGHRGAGTKIAIIDVGFSGLSSAQASGDLPAGVITRDFTGTGIATGASHGTAVAGIVHDVAPQAQLYLIKIGNEVDLDNAIDYCIDQGVHVINHSLGWFNTNYYDGTGTIADIARRATNAGILWVQAAGNSGRRHYGATFTDSNSDTWHDTDVTFIAQAGDRITLYLTWNAWPATADDYDLYLYGPGGALVAASTKTQGGTEQPTERITTTAPQSGTYRARIQRASGSVRPFKLFSIGHDLSPYVAASSMPAPANLGPALSVGAVGWSNYTTGPAQSYSSRGPTGDGRSKPDLVAPDNVTTAVGFYNPFPGTSAAAPHVAGMAALLRSENSGLSGTSLRSALLSMTTSMGSPNTYGAGRLVAALEPTPTPLPDLVVTSISHSPSNPNIGQTVTFQVTVRNQGNASAGTFWVRLQGDGPADIRSISSLAAGASQSLTFSLPLTVSPETFTATADVYGQIQESDETNNTRTHTVTGVQPLPDLVVQSISHSPTNPNIGQTVTFQVTVRNQGNASAGTFWVRLQGSGPADIRSISSLAAGASQSLTFSLPLTVSPETFTATADVYGQVQESDETNNTRTHTVTGVQPLPDLVVQSISHSPTNPNIGQTVTFNVTVRNQGNASAGGFSVRLQGAGPSQTLSVGSLAAGASVTRTFSLPLTTSPETFTATADVFNQVQESDETNNTRTHTVTGVQPLPDLVVQSVSHSPTNPNIGQTVTFNVTVRNQGNASAGSFSVRLQGAGPSHTQSVGSLAAGASVTRTFNLPLTTSPETFTATADVFNQVQESDETNNTRTHTVTAAVNQPPVAEFSFSPTNPDPGQSVSFDGTASYDPDGSIVSYAWQFGDGNTGTGATTTHTYGSQGTYTVRLTVTDNQGATGSKERTIQVGTPPPTLPGMPTIDRPGIYVWGDAQNRWHITVAGSAAWSAPRPFSVRVSSRQQFRNVSATPGSAPAPSLTPNNLLITWEGTVHGDWVDLVFSLERGQTMRLELYLDLDGDGDPKPATDAQAAAMVFLRDKKVNPPNNPFIIGAAHIYLTPRENFRLGSGTLTMHVWRTTIEDLEARAR